jgi:hypothetical protein
MPPKPFYETPEEFDKAVQSYFKAVDKPIISGLAYHLGFESRQSFYDYEKREGFSYSVKRARLRIEMVYEGRLENQACTGAIFALKHLNWDAEEKRKDNPIMAVLNLTGADALNFLKGGDDD